MPTSPHLTRSGLRIAACAALAFPTAVLAQGNDECAGALQVNVGVNPPAASLPFTNAGATTSLPAWTCAPGGNDLWYRFTAPCTGRVTVSTLAAPPQPLDTTLEVFAGTTATCGNLQLLACNDDTCGRQSSVSVAATTGQALLIRVGGFLGATGTFRLDLACAVPGDECATATPVFGGTNGPFTNVGATTSPQPWPCIGAANDVWFSYVATCCGNLTVDTCGSALDTVLEVFAGDCCALESLGCNDNAPSACPQSPAASSLTVAVGAGFTYLIRVGGAGSARGTFQLHLNCTPATPVNDACAGAIAIRPGVNGPFDNFCATTDPTAPWPCGVGLDDVWFSFLATATGPHAFLTCDADFDTVLQVLQGDCGALASLGCNDDAAEGPCAFTKQSFVRCNLTSGVTYHVRVGGFGGAGGHFRLEVRQPAHLVGLTALQSTVLHEDPAACDTAPCTPTPAFPATTGVPYNGGSGFDAALGGTWISNGPTIACVDDSCSYLCAPAPAPTAPATITGLEVVESLNQIWATDSQGNIRRMTRACPPAAIAAGTCSTGLVPTATKGLSGLAVDEGSQLVFYSEADFGAGTTTLHVAAIATPCSRITSVAVPQQLPAPCGTVQPIRGLAADAGNHVLYLTDGLQTLAWHYTPGAGPSITFDPVGSIRCCAVPAGDPLVGLAWRPQRAIPAGPACANGGCPNCPMVHATTGEAMLGNASFGLRLTGVPAGSTVFALFQLGSCVDNGVSLPFLCGALGLAATSVSTLGVVVMPPGSGCSSTPQLFPMALPLSPILAGLPIASQCVAFCGSGGSTISNCLSVLVQGN